MVDQKCFYCSKPKGNDYTYELLLCTICEVSATHQQCVPGQRARRVHAGDIKWQCPSCQQESRTNGQRQPNSEILGDSIRGLRPSEWEPIQSEHSILPETSKITKLRACVARLDLSSEDERFNGISNEMLGLDTYLDEAEEYLSDEIPLSAIVDRSDPFLNSKHSGTDGRTELMNSDELDPCSISQKVLSASSNLLLNEPNLRKLNQRIALEDEAELPARQSQLHNESGLEHQKLRQQGSEPEKLELAWQIASLKGKVQGLNDELQKARQRAIKESRQQKNLETLQNDLRTAEEEFAAKQQGSTEKIRQQESLVSALRTENEHLKKDIVSRNADAAILETKTKKLAKENAALKADLSSLETKKDKYKFRLIKSYRAFFKVTQKFFTENRPRSGSDLQPSSDHFKENSLPIQEQIKLFERRLDEFKRLERLGISETRHIIDESKQVQKQKASHRSSQEEPINSENVDKLSKTLPSSQMSALANSIDEHQRMVLQTISQNSRIWTEVNRENKAAKTTDLPLRFQRVIIDNSSQETVPNSTDESNLIIHPLESHFEGVSQRQRKAKSDPLTPNQNRLIRNGVPRKRKSTSGNLSSNIQEGVERAKARLRAPRKFAPSVQGYLTALKDPMPDSRSSWEEKNEASDRGSPDGNWSEEIDRKPRPIVLIKARQPLAEEYRDQSSNVEDETNLTNQDSDSKRTSKKRLNDFFQLPPKVKPVIGPNRELNFIAADESDTDDDRRGQLPKRRKTSDLYPTGKDVPR